MGGADCQPQKQGGDVDDLVLYGLASLSTTPDILSRFPSMSMKLMGTTYTKTSKPITIVSTIGKKINVFFEMGFGAYSIFINRSFFFCGRLKSHQRRLDDGNPDKQRKKCLI